MRMSIIILRLFWPFGMPMTYGHAGHYIFQGCVIGGEWMHCTVGRELPKMPRVLGRADQGVTEVPGVPGVGDFGSICLHVF